MCATGVFFTLPAAFAFRGLMPRRGAFSGRLPAIDALRLCAGRPNSAKSREHRLPAGESPGASRVSDITTDWDNPVQTLRRSLRTAIPRGRENAAGPSLPDAKLSPGGKALPSPHAPAPRLWIMTFSFSARSPRYLHTPLLPAKTRPPSLENGTPIPQNKAAAPAEGIPQPLLFTSLSLFSRMRPARLRQRKKQRYGSVLHPHILFFVATSFTRL